MLIILHFIVSTSLVSSVIRYSSRIWNIVETMSLPMISVSSKPLGMEKHSLCRVVPQSGCLQNLCKFELLNSITNIR